MDELNSLSFLDLVVRETLRLFAPVPITIRSPTQDDAIPLAHPYVDKYGREHRELRRAFLIGNSHRTSLICGSQGQGRPSYHHTAVGIEQGQDVMGLRCS